MIIKIAIKSISKTRGIDFIDYEILDNIENLKNLIENLVDIEINKYEKKEIKITSQEDLDEMIKQGKISFGFKYRETQIDRIHAKKVALLAFEDGLFKVFINKKEVKKLDDKIIIKENDVFSLIRFTMLTGRYY